MHIVSDALTTAIIVYLYCSSNLKTSILPQWIVVKNKQCFHLIHQEIWDINFDIFHTIVPSGYYLLIVIIKRA